MGRNHVTYLLLVTLLFTTGVRSEEDDQYFYDEEEEEAVSTHQPKFTSQSMDLSVVEGDNVTLPCKVDKLDGAAQIWKAADTSTGRTYFISSSRQYNDPRFRLEDSGSQGRDMMIDSVTPEDSGMYECYISSNPAVSQQHKLDVQFSPMVTTSPKEGDLEVEEGKHIVLACKAEGNPAPTVSWSKKGGLLPYGEKKHVGETLDIAVVQSEHAGVYACTADNSVGTPEVRHWTLSVDFAPQVTVPVGTVYTGAGHSAEIVCDVRGQPTPQVTWSRVEGSPLDPAHYQQLQNKDRHSLKVTSVEDADIGVYNCQAVNAHGKATGIVHLTGNPKPVKVISPPNGDQKEEYTLNLTIVSYSPLVEYKVLYRRVQDEESDEPDADWQEKVVSAASAQPKEGGIVFHQSTVLKDLEPASIYEAIVTASNEHGWSQHSEEGFRFSTQGANESATASVGGAALKSTHPSSAVSLRWTLTPLMTAALLQFATL